MEKLILRGRERCTNAYFPDVCSISECGERECVILPTSRLAVTMTSSEAMKTPTVLDARANGERNGAASAWTKLFSVGFGFIVYLPTLSEIS
jgi:hypothetical protein